MQFSMNKKRSHHRPVGLTHGMWKMGRDDHWMLMRLHGECIKPLPKLTFSFDSSYQTVDQRIDIKMVYLDFSKADFI